MCVDQRISTVQTTTANQNPRGKQYPYASEVITLFHNKTKTNMYNILNYWEGNLGLYSPPPAVWHHLGLKRTHNKKHVKILKQLPGLDHKGTISLALINNQYKQLLVLLAIRMDLLQRCHCFTTNPWCSKGLQPGMNRTERKYTV